MPVTLVDVPVMTPPTVEAAVTTPVTLTLVPIWFVALMFPLEIFPLVMFPDADIKPVVVKFDPTTLPTALNCPPEEKVAINVEAIPPL